MSAFARSFNLSAAGVNHAAALDDLLGYLLVGRAQGVEWSDWPRRTSSIDLKGMLNRKAAGQPLDKPADVFKAWTESLRQSYCSLAFGFPHTLVRQLIAVWQAYLDQDAYTIQHHFTVPPRRPYLRVMSSDDPANSSIFESDRNVGVFGTVVAIESSPNLSHLGIAEEYKIQGVGEEVKVLLGPGSLIRDPHMWAMRRLQVHHLSGPNPSQRLSTPTLTPARVSRKQRQPPTAPRSMIAPSPEAPDGDGGAIAGPVQPIRKKRACYIDTFGSAGVSNPASSAVPPASRPAGLAVTDPVKANQLAQSDDYRSNQPSTASAQRDSLLDETFTTRHTRSLAPDRPVAGPAPSVTTLRINTGTPPTLSAPPAPSERTIPQRPATFSPEDEQRVRRLLEATPARSSSEVSEATPRPTTRHRTADSSSEDEGAAIPLSILQRYRQRPKKKSRNARRVVRDTDNEGEKDELDSSPSPSCTSSNSSVAASSPLSSIGSESRSPSIAREDPLARVKTMTPLHQNVDKSFDDALRAELRSIVRSAGSGLRFRHQGRTHRGCPLTDLPLEGRPHKEQVDLLQQQIQLERRMTDRMVQSLLPIFGNRELFAPTEFELERFLANVRGEVENAMQGSGNLVEAEMQVKLPILAPKPELRQQSPRATDVEGEHATPPNKADTSVARLVGARLAQEETASELASVKLELEATRKETLRLQAELVTVKGYRAAAELERDDLVIWTTAAEASRKTFASKADADKAAIERAREEVSQAKTSEARALQRAVTAETELAKSRQERQELETALKVEKEKGALDRDRLCLQANGLYKKQAAVFKKDKEISARLISELKAQVKAAEDTAADVAAIRATENGTIHPPRPQLPQILAGDQPSFEQLQQYYVQKLANLLNAHNASIAENLELRSQNDNILGQLRDTLKDLEKADTDLSDKRGEIKRLNELLNMHGIRGGTWDVKVGSSLAGQAQMQLGLGFRQPSNNSSTPSSALQPASLPRIDTNPVYNFHTAEQAAMQLVPSQITPHQHQPTVTQPMGPNFGSAPNLSAQSGLPTPPPSATMPSAPIATPTQAQRSEIQQAQQYLNQRHPPAGWTQPQTYTPAGPAHGPAQPQR